MIEAVTRDYARLVDVLDPSLGSRICVEDWTVKGLLAVRAWWSEAVVSWVRTAAAGDEPVLPAPGYKWNETPQLNAEIARRRVSYRAAVERLDAAYRDVLHVIGEVDDHTLTTPGVYSWAGKNGVCGIINLNTARQYRTARTFILRID